MRSVPAKPTRHARNSIVGLTSELNPKSGGLRKRRTASKGRRTLRPASSWSLVPVECRRSSTTTSGQSIRFDYLTAHPRFNEADLAPFFGQKNLLLPSGARRDGVVQSFSALWRLKMALISTGSCERFEPFAPDATESTQPPRNPAPIKRGQSEANKSSPAHKSELEELAIDRRVQAARQKPYENNRRDASARKSDRFQCSGVSYSQAG